MKKMLTLALIFLFLKPINIFATDIYRFYYFNDSEKLIFKNYEFIGNFKDEEKLFYFINQVFNKKYKNINGFFIENENLYLNFNQNIENMPKGSFGEICMIKSILYTLFQFENVNTITFLQEGELFLMPAGSYVYKFTRDYLEKLV